MKALFDSFGSQQHASPDDGLCPGDVSILTSSMADILMHTTARPAFISSSASCAGVAAVAGEMAKDEKHLAAVERVASDFIPLVVKCFGVWTPFVLKKLCTYDQLIKHFTVGFLVSCKEKAALAMFCCTIDEQC